MKLGHDHDIEQRYVWQAVAFVSGAAAAACVRRAAVTLWRTGRHEDPPIHPAARDVSWRDALIWAMSVAVGAAVARVVAERTAAAAWNAATGARPPVIDD
jgi:Protein of unknown function (DUF4235)